MRLPGDRIALDPDEQVQHVVRLIFDKFDELGSVGAVLRYLVRHDIKLGMRVQSGPDDRAAGVAPADPCHPQHDPPPSVFMQDAMPLGSVVAIRGGRRPGVPHSGRVRVEPLKWEVMIPDKVPAYITWDRYLANQKRLAANRCLPTTPGAPRRGPSLLSGAGVLRPMRAEDAGRLSRQRNSCLLCVQILERVESCRAVLPELSPAARSRRWSPRKCCTPSSRPSWS